MRKTRIAWGISYVAILTFAGAVAGGVLGGFFGFLVGSGVAIAEMRVR